MFCALCLTVAGALLRHSPELAALEHEWPQFRGPGGQGHSDATGLPLTWSESENIAWKTAIPGEGHSSPVISGDQVWLTTAITHPLSAEEEQQRLAQLKNRDSLRIAAALSLQAVLVSRTTGQILRQIPLFEVSAPEPKHSLNSYASPTPVIAGEHVYFHFGTYGTACVERQSGKVLWKNDAFHVIHQNGPGSSPVVWNDRLIIHFDGTDAQYIVAFERTTGEVAWKVDRSGEMDATPEFRKSYGTPLVVETLDFPLVISPAANWVYGYDARDGREVWKAGYGQLGFSVVPRPVVLDRTAYIATSYLQSRLLAVRIDGQGDVTDSHIVWKSDRQIPKKPSMLVAGDRLYYVCDNGILRCVSTATGDDYWLERLPGEYSASPLAAEGRIYFFGQNGVATVLADSRDYRELAKNQLDGEFMASPAVAGSALFLRTTTHLYCVEVPEQGEEDHHWTQISLDERFRSEGATAADVNNDGTPDVIAGDMIYLAPAAGSPAYQDGVAWKRGEIRTPGDFVAGIGYSNNFANFAWDINRDGWQDIILVGFPGEPFHWYENPGTNAAANAAGHWPEHVAWTSACNESPEFEDLNGDGVPEMIIGSQPESQLGFLPLPSPENAAAKFEFHAVNETGDPARNGSNRYYHGLGVGDMNGDGHRDILIAHGWLESPGSLDTAGPWKFHEVATKTDKGLQPLPPCANIYADDLDLDGDADLVFSSAHQFGVWWAENQGESGWQLHEIDMRHSQTHALEQVDINGDGQLDYVTGKRFFAHNGNDPGAHDPVVMYWYEVQRAQGRPPEIRPHRIMAGTGTGVGTQFAIRDMNLDGRPDIVLSNKRGVHVLLQR